MADPTVIQGEDGVFYVFATCQKADGRQPVFKSNDLIDWQFSNYLFEDDQIPKGEPHETPWAPDAIKYKDTYLLAYAFSRDGEYEKNGIGLGISDKPNGPYKNLGLIFTSKSIGVTNSIDPSLIIEDGRLYLMWGSFYGIYIAELIQDNDGNFKVKDPDSKKKLAGNAFEGTHIFKRDGYYYLFASTGRCCLKEKSSYRVVVGRSTDLFGPYLDSDGVDMLDNGYNFVVGGNEKFVGPGHGSRIVADKNGETWYIYHSYKRSDIEKGRMLMLDKIKWTDNGWPYIYHGMPTGIKTKGPAL